MKKRVGWCLVIAAFAFVAAFLFPWGFLENLKVRLLGNGEQYSSLRVYSLGGNMKVYVDGEEKGTAYADGSYFEVIPISVGEHEVTLVREASVAGFYRELNQVITFESGFDTVMSWELGPTDATSSGWTLYAQKGEDASTLDGIGVDISCEPVDCLILVDGAEEHRAPLDDLHLSLDQQHTIKARKEGYQDLEFTFLPEDASKRDLLRGYQLFLDIHLFQYPLG